MKKLNVSVVVSLLTIGGAEQLLLELLKNMNREQFHIQVVFLQAPGRLGQEVIDLGFPVQTNVLRSRFDMFCIFRLAKILAAQKTDILFLINHLNSLVFGPTAARLANVPVCINWANETFKRYRLHRLTMLGRRIMHRGIDIVVAAAQGHMRYIADVEKIPLHKIRVIYNGVDPLRFQSDVPPEQAKQRLGIPAGSPVVSILAVLRPDKAHEIFLEAARIILRSEQKTHFLVIGDGPRKEHLTQLARDMGIDKNVHFLGFRRDIGDILAAVDINTLSSKPEQETLSVAAIEAMSAGVPMVCTDVGFMREIVIPHKTGYLVSVADPRDLADKLLCLLQDGPRRKAMGAAAADLVREKLSVNHMARSFEELFMNTYTRKIAGRRQSL